MLQTSEYSTQYGSIAAPYVPKQKAKSILPKNFALKFLGLSMFIYVVMVCQYSPETINQKMAVTSPMNAAAVAPAAGATAPAAAAAAPSTTAAPTTTKAFQTSMCIHNKCQAALAQMFSSDDMSNGQTKKEAFGQGFDWTKFAGMGGMGSGSGASSTGTGGFGMGFDWSQYAKMGSQGSKGSTGMGGFDWNKFQDPEDVAHCLDYNDPKMTQDCMNAAKDRDNAKLLEDCSYCTHCLPVEHGKSMPSKERCDSFTNIDWPSEYIPKSYQQYAKEGIEQQREMEAKEAAEKKAKEEAAKKQAEATAKKDAEVAAAQAALARAAAAKQAAAQAEAAAAEAAAGTM